MQIVGYAIKGNSVLNSLNEHTDNNHLEFLLQPKKDTIRLMYNLTSCVHELKNILKLNEYQSNVLDNTSYLRLNDHIIRYIPGKLLSIKKDGLTNNMTYYGDASQYYEIENYTEPSVQVDKAKKVGEEVYNALKSIGLAPTGLTSSIRCYEKDVLSTIDSCCDNDVPQEAVKYASKSLDNNSIIIITADEKFLGKFDIRILVKEMCEAIMLCQDVRYGMWNKVTHIHDCDYGYYKIRVKNIETYINKGVYILNKDYYKEKINVIDGWEWYLNKKVLPYYNNMVDLYEHWRNARGIKKKVVEDIVIGIYDKMLENKNKRNIVWATEVQTSIMIKLVNKRIKRKN